MRLIAHARSPSKRNPPPIGLPLFDWQPSPFSSFNPLHAAARRLSVRCRVPFGVALAHAEAAGLGGEVK